MPLGVISLSAYLKKFIELHSECIDFNVELNKELEFKHTDFYSYFESKLVSLLPGDFVPDYVAISALFTPAYQSIIDLSLIVRKLFPETTVLVGGNLPTSMYKEILSDSPAIDAICFGEGEKPLLGLNSAENKSEYLAESES